MTKQDLWIKRARSEILHAIDYNYLATEEKEISKGEGQKINSLLQEAMNIIEGIEK